MKSEPMIFIHIRNIMTLYLNPKVYIPKLALWGIFIKDSQYDLSANLNFHAFILPFYFETKSLTHVQPPCCPLVLQVLTPHYSIQLAVVCKKDVV